MADKKISALTAATTPLAGTEVLPVVQGGSTVKVSVANLTAGRSVSASNLLVQTDTGLEMVLVNQTSASGVALARVRLSHGSGASGVFEVGAGYGVIGLTTSGPFVFTTNSAERMRIEDTGNLTIANGNLVPATAGKGIDFSANTASAGMTSELLTWYEEGNWTPTYSGWTIAPTNVHAKYTRVGRLVTLNYTGLDGVSVPGASEIGGLPFTSNSQQGASVLMKDVSSNNPGVYAFATVGANASAIQSMTAVTFTGLYWSFSVTYMV